MLLLPRSIVWCSSKYVEKRVGTNVDTAFKQLAHAVRTLQIDTHEANEEREAEVTSYKRKCERGGYILLW